MTEPSAGRAPSNALFDRQAALMAFTAVVLAAPALVFRYLPMTDLPQHYAVASIVSQFDDPALGFSERYELELGRTLYLLPYALAWVGTHLVGLELAMRAVVFCSLLAMPIGVVLCLRAMNRPAWLGVLALPFVYNRTAFWGLVSSNLGVGLGFIGVALLLGCRDSARRRTALTAVGALTAVTHVYGLGVLLGFAACLFTVSEAHRRREHVVPLIPAGLGVIVWLWRMEGAPGYGPPDDPTLVHRLVMLPIDLLGGYQSYSELGLLLVTLLVTVLLAARHAPFSPTRYRALEGAERAAWVMIAGNLLLHFLLPLHADSVKCIYIRHGVIAWSMLPLVLHPSTGLTHALTRVLGAALALGTLGTAWVFTSAFERDARAFDRVLAHIPPHATVATLTYEHNGSVGLANPYTHFSGYVQAFKGADTSMSFADLAFTMPVARRASVPRADVPEMLEWWPWLWDEARFGHAFHYVIIRGTPPPEFPLPPLPMRVVVESGAWRLLERTATPPERE